MDDLYVGPDPEEVDELERLLAETPGAMPLQEALGFLTAIVSAPTTFMPSDWFPMMFGERVWESEGELRRITNVVMRLYNSIVTDLNDGWEIGPLDTGEDVVASWCRGYLSATRMDPVWMGDEVGVDLLLPFGVLAGDFDLVGQEGSDGNIIEDPSAHFEKYRRQLPALVCALNEYWVAWRSENHAVSPVSSGPRVGRNDPCPCGSGRKYKRCCASPSS